MARAAFVLDAVRTLAEWPDLDPEKVNAFGGAIAIGRPLRASGTRVLGSLVHRLVAAGGSWRIAASCIGVGQGLAVVVEA